LKATVARSEPRSHHSREAPGGRGPWTLFACAVAAASVVGFAIASGGLARQVAIAAGVFTLVGTLVWAAFNGRVPRHFTAVELPVVLLLLSQEILRRRATEAIASNPLDAAGSYRVACVGLAFLLGLLALTGGHRASDIGRVTTRPFRLYCLYALVVLLGAFTSVNPALTVYHGIELLVGITVLSGAYLVAGPASIDRLLRVLYWWLVIEMASVWIGVAVFPTEAIGYVNSPLRWQLNGVFPSLSSNGVGTIGLMVAAWSLALLISPKEPPRRRRLVTSALAIAGSVTLLFAQYRTGYVAAALALVLLLALRKRLAMAGLAAACVVAAWIWGAGVIVQRAEPFALRGQNLATAATLSGRLNYWSAAIPVWERSPLIGRGLLTASRFEVLDPLGHTTTSTIHGTWVEALLGTGVIGVAFLGASFLVLLARAAREALADQGRIVPILLLVVLSVRSLTGSTFEQMGGALLFLVLALSFRDPPGRAPSARFSMPAARSRV
jgi:O-antigen ligase